MYDILTSARTSQFLSRSFHDQFHFKSLKQYVGRTYYPLLMTSSGWYGLPLHTGTKTYEPILQTTFTRRLKNQSGAAMLKTPLFVTLKAWELTINRPIKTELHIVRWEKIKKFSAIVWRRNQGRNEVYFFVADPVFLRKFLIPDPKSDENFDPWSHKI